VPDSTAPHLVDAAIEDLVASLAAAIDEAAPLVAEASVANLVCMVDDTMGDDEDDEGPSEMQRQFWSDVGADLATREDEPSWILLTGLCRLVDDVYRAPLDQAHLARGDETPGPGWLDQLATARLRRAVVVEDLAGDGVGVTLGYEVGGAEHTLLVYIDNNLGGIAKDIGIGPPIDDVLARSSTDDALVARDVAPGAALGLVLAGLGQTMHTIDAPTSDDYDHFHSLLVLRITRETTRIQVPLPPSELTAFEREAVMHEFMSTGYGGRAAAEPDVVQDIARKWLDHALDYTVGGPLRVSAVLVELFLADWLPRNAAGADRDYVAAVPSVLKCWLRFAASQTPVPTDLVTNALAAVEQFTPVMRRRVEDPSAWEDTYPALNVPEDDPLEASWLSLPELGVAPRPDCTGLAPHTATQLERIARYAWVLAGETLGTDYATPAFEVAERVARQAPETFDEAQLTTWPAAITWLLAEDDDIVGRGKFLSATQLSGELNVGAPTLRAKARRIRAVLGDVRWGPRWSDF